MLQFQLVSDYYKKPMNPLIVTIIIALATFIISIFTANWLNQQHVNKLMEKQDDKIKAQFETLAVELKSIHSEIDHTHQGLERLERQMEQRLDRIERQLDQIFKPSLPR